MDIINPHISKYIHIHTILWLYMWRNDIIIYHISMICMSIFFIYVCFFHLFFETRNFQKKNTRLSLKRLAMTSTLNSCVASPSDGSAPGSEGGGCDSSGGEIGEIGEAREGSWKPWWFDWLKVNWWLHLMVKYLMVTSWLLDAVTYWLLHA